MEPTHSGLDVGRGKGLPGNRGGRKGGVVDGAKWHHLHICDRTRLDNVHSSGVCKREMGKTPVAHPQK